MSVETKKGLDNENHKVRESKRRPLTIHTRITAKRISHNCLHHSKRTNTSIRVQIGHT